MEPAAEALHGDVDLEGSGRASYLDEALRLSATGAFAWRARTGALFLTDETYRILGVSPGTAPTLALALTRVHPDDRAEVQRAFERVAADGAGLDLEVRVLLEDGTVRHVRVLARPRRQAATEELEVVGAVRDVTGGHTSEDAVRKMRAELSHKGRISALGTLTASIAHEVNQPLAGVLMNSSACVRWLQASPPNLAEALEAAQRAARDGARAGDVIGRLRALFTRAPVAAAPVDLNSLIEEVLALLRRELQLAGVSLHTELAADLPTILADRVQLQQVLLNLIMNAMESLRLSGVEPRDLTVISRAEHELEVSVTDSGPGVAPELVDQVFEPFFTTKEAGMGIGLSISRDLVESMGGRIWVESSPGAGATFRFTVPCSGAGS